MAFDPQGLPSVDEIWQWHEWLAQNGPRYTGSPNHQKFTDWLQQQFDPVPGFDLRVERMKFQRWLADYWSLSIAQDPTVGPSGPVPVSYYFPYSGMTGPSGISGTLVDLGDYIPALYTPQFWQRAAGAIALVRVPPCTFSFDVGQIPTGAFEPNQASLLTVAGFELSDFLVTNPVFQGMLAPVPLLDARKANVLGVICAWTGMSDDLVANQYNPFTSKYPNASGLPEPGDTGCPALWVGDTTGRSLAHYAQVGTPTVTLKLTATITKDATTDTIWGVLPGSGTDHERGLIVNTHTDGPSVPEDNGALGLLALAKYFANPRPRRHDLYFVMATGHFQLPQFMKTISERPVAGNDAISWWMRNYPDIYSKALAGLTMEHLGCKRWADDINGQYVDTGGFDWGVTYTTQRLGSSNPSNLEQQAYLEAVAATNAAGAVAHPVVTMLPLPLFFGEGAPLYAGGLGTVSLCPAPSYLLQAGSRTNPQLLNLDKLDKQLIYGQIQSFARTIETLDGQPAEAF